MIFKKKKTINKLIKKLKSIEKNGKGVVAGSRKHVFEEEEAKIERTFVRKLLGLVFSFIVKVICGVKLNDT